MDPNEFIQKVKDEIAKIKQKEDNAAISKKPKKKCHSSYQKPKGEKVICPFCERTFTKSYFNTHIRVHTGEKPYQCSKCNYASALVTSLNYHIENHHPELAMKKDDYCR